MRIYTDDLSDGEGRQVKLFRKFALEVLIQFETWNISQVQNWFHFYVAQPTLMVSVMGKDPRLQHECSGPHRPLGFNLPKKKNSS